MTLGAKIHLTAGDREEFVVLRPVWIMTGSARDFLTGSFYDAEPHRVPANRMIECESLVTSAAEKGNFIFQIMFSV